MNSRYIEIYEEIKKEILEQKIRAGEKLPSENTYCKIYGASRGTIRKALDLLVEEGFVHRQHGKGMYVLDHHLISFSFGGLASFKEAAESSGQFFTTLVPLFEKIRIDDSLHEKTKLPVDKEAYKIYRIRKLDQERVILDINYFLTEIVSGLTINQAEGSIYEYIEEKLGLKIGFAQRVIQVEPVTAKDRHFLDVKSHPVVAVVKNFVHLQDGTQFEYTESRHRPDRFVFTDFVRRR
ncbi:MULTISPECIES: trehalose operon repressor [Thermoactinomyces]|jgi:GntR family transcriptional regulator, trehalose operon transcriptional repressor|uniref:Trehalose operon repressor n=1 Tax=Thermoactinomyces daqus TaxID=1329516 RepID=A0A7W1XD45_9BACL|nr:MULTISPECIES: trehalose operon repressor [Thermoactinomyces]MBA4544413.1 trehalose operon repressor [Thermoactinomyces daqus]MBH8598188.1 trehalose operon repressor [Thermoactinomyces sp. CICC 10523]MBH8603217.1 trehalose operon repressor [Thermoactinomyces sp. CICC 10522]MBH8608627.1 trehalose operon repressor [Thermoactinomyces sp. CICC 10521]